MCITSPCQRLPSSDLWISHVIYQLTLLLSFPDDIVYETSVSNVTNLTSVSATLTWQPVPDVINYRLEVKGVEEMTRNLTNVTDGLFNLTPGTQYTVQVFPIKCRRDLNAQEFFFTTSEFASVCNIWPPDGGTVYCLKSQFCHKYWCRTDKS